jgi:D-glycero-beta-D-manno-heptose 1-phosphate adenylyltransferase
MRAYQKLIQKIYPRETLFRLSEQWKNEGKKLVFTNGCFDLIHAGHLDYLSKASDLGDRFIIAVNSDASVRRLKGEGRPVKDEKSRLELLASLFFVDAVFLFQEDTPLHVISQLIPDILVKGGDYKENEIVGADMVKKNGGKVVVLPFLEGYSSTILEKKIIDNYRNKANT